MAYPTESYIKAKQILDRRREKATMQAAADEEKILQKVPEVESIKYQLAKIGLSI